MGKGALISKLFMGRTGKTPGVPVDQYGPVHVYFVEGTYLIYHSLIEDEGFKFGNYVG